MDQFIDQFQELQNKNRKIFIRLVVIGSIIFGLFFLAVGGVLYLAHSITKEINVSDAQKIGNWVMPDSDYALNSAYEIKILKSSEKFIKISDKKSGNNFWIIESELKYKAFLKLNGVIDENNFNYYGIENYQMISSRMKEIEGGSISYNLAKWEALYFPSAGASEGFFGRIDCVKNKKSITILAANRVGRYDHDRALEFINSFRCREGALEMLINEEKKVKPTVKVKNKIDSDNDGLPDFIESSIGMNSQAADSDFDGFNDLDEIKNGYSPLIAGVAGKMSAEQLESMKIKIKTSDIVFYNKIFEDTVK